MFTSIENLCLPLAKLKTEVWTTDEPRPFACRKDGIYRELVPGESWGALFSCGWFRFSGTVPEGVAAEELALRIDVNGELLIYTAEGEPLRALTNVSSVFDRTLGLPEKIFIPLQELEITSGAFEIWADAGCNDLFGEYSNGGVLHCADIVQRKPAELKAHYDREQERFAAENPFLSDGLPVYAVGHAHLDLVWLWPERESRRKGLRTFATAIANQKKYPWYFFGASQPQLYQWVSEDSPELFAAVKKSWQHGRWDLQGAMWVEADTHIPDGESLMRQFIYGQQYWRDTFGCEVENVWLPDVFGYSGSLPAIARQNGAKYILTMKNAWNLCNKFPYNAFQWEGIDGTSILAYRLPEETYNGTAHNDAIAKCLKQDAQRHITGASLMLYGIGDGGAGPGEAHLEMLSRLSNKPDMPEIIHGSAGEFFARISSSYSNLPLVKGELYLENHHGTFTTCGAIKRINRTCEILRQDMEFAAVLLGKPLPEWYSDFEKDILFMQFHDCVPGSSIERVYTEAAEKLAYWQQRINDWYGPCGDVYFNPTGTPLRRIQQGADGPEILELAPFSCGRIRHWQGKGAVAADNVLENEIVRLQFAPDGRISSWQFLPFGTELLSAPAGFELYTDKGNAWNIDYGTYEAGPIANGMELVCCEFSADGATAFCRQTYRYRNSTVKADFSLAPGEAVCRVMVNADWREPEHLMRFEIPCTIESATASYAAQFGFKKFSTLNDTPEHKAQQEISAQRWVRLAGKRTAVSAATDCKYGFAVKEGKMNLTLLRAPKRPGAFIAKDDNAISGADQYNDLTSHSFAFSFMADSGDITLPAREAEWLNRTPHQLPAGSSVHCTLFPWAQQQFAVSALRPAWYGGGTLIRIYEQTGKAGVLQLPEGVTATAVKPDGRELDEEISPVEFHAFEIKTLRITPDRHEC